MRWWGWAGLWVAWLLATPAATVRIGNGPIFLLVFLGPLFVAALATVLSLARGGDTGTAGVPPEVSAAARRAVDRGELPSDPWLWPAIGRRVAYRRDVLPLTRRSALVSGSAAIAGAVSLAILRRVHGRSVILPVLLVAVLALAVALALLVADREESRLDALDRALTWSFPGSLPGRPWDGPPGSVPTTQGGTPAAPPREGPPGFLPAMPADHTPAEPPDSRDG
jgi:hypothetical protein